MEILIDLPKIRHNIAVVRDICRNAGLQTVWVAKGCHSHPDIVRALGGMEGEILGDVYLSNIERNAGIFPGELMMIQFPDAGQAEEAVTNTDINLISNREHARALSIASKKLGKTQRVILMVDVGNLREGVMPASVLPTVRQILACPGIELTGLGTSVGCYGGYLAGEEDMKKLVKIAKETEAESGYRFKVLSAGSGTMLLDLARTGKIPHGINQLRVGAAFLVGEKPPTREPIVSLCRDGFIFRGEVLELARKPSIPSGRTGSDAFGKKVVFEDLGERTRALMNFGMVDIDIYDLTPVKPGVNIIGGTSNYTICDVSSCEADIEVGKCIDFRMAYSAMARAMASQHVKKTVLV